MELQVTDNNGIAANRMRKYVKRTIESSLSNNVIVAIAVFVLFSLLFPNAIIKLFAWETLRKLPCICQLTESMQNCVCVCFLFRFMAWQIIKGNIYTLHILLFLPISVSVSSSGKHSIY